MRCSSRGKGSGTCLSSISEVLRISTFRLFPVTVSNTSTSLGYETSSCAEALKALHLGLNAMIFSDNVALDQEVFLKKTALEKGLMVLGPDCGTAILHGVPLAFANVVRRGNIGLVAASGTGLQQVTCLIDRWGGGVSHAIGTGGRDLDAAVGGITMQQGIAALGALWASRVAYRAGGALPAGATEAPAAAQVAGLNDTFSVAVILIGLALLLAAWGLVQERRSRRPAAASEPPTPA